MSQDRISSFLSILFAILQFSPLIGELPPITPPKEVRLELQKEEVFINPDTTYKMTLTYEKTILTHQAIFNHQTMASPSYFPESNQVELLEAYTLQPDGTKILVPEENIFTITTPEDPSAPGFVTSLQKHVAFPHLKIGSTLHVKWIYTELKPPIFPFADIMSPSFESETVLSEMSVNAPEGMFIKWAERGGFQVEETTEGNRLIIKGALGPQPARTKEPFMDAPSDFLPFFQVSTIASWEEIGNIISQISTPSQEVTEEIVSLANSIVGEAKGQDAACAIYNWTASHITYLETAISDLQGYAPPKASVIIANRFGDCKAHSCVLQTLLKAVGIASYPALVNWDNSLTQYPLPIPNFNHEMVFVPSLDLFLNPTDQYSSFNSPLAQTNFYPKEPQVLTDKPVLIAKPTASLLTKTPPAIAGQNHYNITSQMQIDLLGNIQAKGSLNTTGCFADVTRALLSQDTPLNQMLTEILLRNGIQGEAAGLAPNLNNLNAPMNLTYSWEGKNVAQKNGEAFLFQIPTAIDLFTKPFFIQYLSFTSPRLYPLIIGATIYEWNHTLALPKNYEIKGTLPNIHLENPAGSYIATYRMNQGSLEIQRKLLLKKTVYSPEEYVSVAMLIEQMLQDLQAIFACTPNSILNSPKK